LQSTVLARFSAIRNNHSKRAPDNRIIFANRRKPEAKSPNPARPARFIHETVIDFLAERRQQGR